VTPYSVWSFLNSFGNTYWDGTNNFPVRPINADLVSAGSSFEAVGLRLGQTSVFRLLNEAPRYEKDQKQLI
jgi:hypothetical protein